MQISQGRVELELHELSGGSGTALLLLHSLYGSSGDWGEGFAPRGAHSAPYGSAWAGPVFSLDLAGHGRSAWVKGGAYTPEILAGGVDAALDRIGTAALVGAGVSAYVSLLVAGARPEQVSAALFLPGAGLIGGGPQPAFEREMHAIGDVETLREGCDPLVSSLDRDVRPPDYAEVFARKASRLVLFDDGTPRPPWWEAVRAVGGVTVVGEVAAGLTQLRSQEKRR